MSLMIAADTGGTFTDLVALDTKTGHLVLDKQLTTYGDLSQGIHNCIRGIGINLHEVDSIGFGTTLVINSFVQRTGAKTALITTRGHRDVLEIRRCNRPDVFDLQYRPAPPLVDRSLRMEIAERTDGQGRILTEIDEDELDQLVERLRGLGVEAIAISLLNAYLNDTNERHVLQYLRSRMPECYISSGTELTRQWGEYERSSTAVANAFVGPRLNDFIRRLHSSLSEAGFKKSFHLTASNGGLISADRARRQPVALLESGPVGGCIGAGALARSLGVSKAIAFDMGGTTAKCALLENGEFQVRTPYFVDGPVKGFPVHASILDIIEVGTGGGSIAWLDSQGGVHIGPRSAGSEPGPACYGRGGQEPTITDANLVLGRICATAFLGGGMPLDEAAARHAIEARVVKPLQNTAIGNLDETAQGILTLGLVIMAGAIRRLTIERGHDPREFSLIAFGGGGPLHATTLARELSIPEVIVPPRPEVFSALGMLLSNARLDETQTFIRPLNEASLQELMHGWEEIQHKIAGDFARDMNLSAIVFHRQVSLRIRGQMHALRLPCPVHTDVTRLSEMFEAAYLKHFGHLPRGSSVEIESFSVTGIAEIHKLDFSMLLPKFPNGGDISTSTRHVFFSESGTRVETTIYNRASLPIGFHAHGPAIIEEFGSSTVIGPFDRFEIGRFGEVRIRFDEIAGMRGD